MSAQLAHPAPDLAPLPPLPQPKRAPRLRRRIALLAISFLLIIVLAVGVLLFSPPVLEAFSAMALKPQPGTVQWNGRDRITVVAMGLTQRTTEPARTDTLLVMDIDPAHRHVNMVSVPRDLWVDIPGYGHGKLAIAYALGGRKLAAYTLERSLGIPVDYSIALTFHSFMRLIDAMGGVTVNVPQNLDDPTYPCLVGYAYCPLHIKGGVQHMNGTTALEFVRERHAFAQQDLARVKDQQAFSEAVKHQLMAPTTWTRLPTLLNTLQQGLITNVPLNDLPEMGVQTMLARGGVDHSYINLENGMVKSDWSKDGQSILLPTDSTSIPTMIHRLFSDPMLAQENASVMVLNGSATSGAASDAQGTLAGLGFHTVSASNADSQSYRQSEVIVNTAVPGAADYTARRLQRLLGARLLHTRLPGGSAQVAVIIGADFP